MKFLASTCLAVVFAFTTATATETRSLQASTTVGRELLTAINAARAKNGFTQLCLSTKLSLASQTQANSMAAGGYISPVGSDSSMPTARAKKVGFNTTGVYEVVGAGYSNASVAVDEWMKLADSDTNLLGDFKFLGAAMTSNEAQQYKTFWVVDFAKGSGEVCA